jgi:hypothetical protein
MNLKEETLTLLAEVPADSPAWRQLSDDARLLRELAEAENDVRSGRLYSLDEVKAQFESKWASRRSKSN